ncbi:hypothetical protein A8926_7714 [Saccharopolyspora spinosa]|uniref:Uncharacterized protein n=2 Tax=Saccharopolyspora spinosa TaxID=60894 RepID=A0A2N3Y9F8_SACSN|nr:hypothetical protein A8926_7714 [Saccharopolyspora spinosa]
MRWLKRTDRLCRLPEWTVRSLHVSVLGVALGVWSERTVMMCVVTPLVGLTLERTDGLPVLERIRRPYRALLRTRPDGRL